MNKPPFERAIVVSQSQVYTLLKAIEDERVILQTKKKLEQKPFTDFISDSLVDLAKVEDRLREVMGHMETEETIWEEHMKEYEESAYEDSSTEGDEK